MLRAVSNHIEVRNVDIDELKVTSAKHAGYLVTDTLI